jgi:2'-5' RNA ligase
MRLFLAIHLPEDIKGRLVYAQEHWTKDEVGRISWTKKDNLHVTLKFFGELEEDQSGTLIDPVRSIDKPRPFNLRTESMIYFPPRGPIRILGVELGGELDRVSQLYKAIEEGCEQIGYAKEDRPFRAHITIGRSRDGLPGHLRREHDEKPWPEASPMFLAQSISLMKSDLTQKGPIYSEIAAFSL